MPSILSKPTPNAEAAKFIADKPPVSRLVFDNLIPEVQARAFVISGIEDANVLQAVRDRIADLPAGADWDKVKADIADKISPWLGEGAERRAELVLRQQGFQAYAAAQYQVMDRQRAAFPFWQYQSADDINVRDTHAALNGLVLPADSSFWATHFPPWEWGCRCYVAPLSAEDAADMQTADAAKPVDQRRVLDDAQRARLEKSGVVERAVGGNGVPRPVNVTPAPDAPRFDPGSLKLDVKALKQRYDAATWRRFELIAKGVELKDGRKVWDWLTAKPVPAPRAAPVPAPAARPAPVVVKVPKPAAPVAPVVPVAPVAPVVPPVAPAAPIAPAPVAPKPVVPAPVAPPVAPIAPVAQVRKEIQNAVYKKEVPMGRGINAAQKLTNGKTVVYKPVTSEPPLLPKFGIKQGTQYLREVASSVLDERLKLGLVPPTAMLNRNGVPGSAQLFRDGFRTAADTPNRWAMAARLPLRTQHDWQLFDDLVNHLDRHGNNWMLREVNGVVELALIDNGLAFSLRPQPKRVSPPMEHKPIDAVNMARLKDLLADESAVRASLQPYLEPRAIDMFFARVQKLLTRKTYGDADP